MHGDSKRRTKFVVVVTGEDGEQHAYGPWLSVDKANAWAKGLIAQGYDAQSARLEEPTFKAVRDFFGRAMDQRQDYSSTRKES